MGRAFKITLAGLAFVGALLLVAIHVRRGLESGTGSWAAGEVRATTSMASRRVMWREPTSFAEELALKGVPTKIAFGPSATSAVVAFGERGRDATLWFVEFDTAGQVTSERPLTVIDAPGDELAPAFDGHTLWFASDRAGGTGGLDLFRARYVQGRFEGVEPAPAGVNSAADDVDPTAYAGELVFASDRGGDGFDLWSAVLATGSLARLDVLSTNRDERDPAFAPDGGSLWFTADTRGEFMVQRAFRAGSRWLPRESVEALDGEGSERAVTPIANGFEVAFLRDGVWMQSASVELGLVTALPWTWAEILLLASLLALAAFAWFARDLSRYDVLIAAWVVSILVHVLLLLCFGGVRLSGGGSESRGDEGPTIRVRVAPALDGRGIVRGVTGQLERVAIERSITSAQLAASADLASTIRAPAALEQAPGRLAVEAPRAPAEPRALEDLGADAAPSAVSLEVARRELPGPGRSTRSSPATDIAMERLASSPRVPFSSDVEPRSSRALDVERVAADTVEVARQTATPHGASTERRSLSEADFESAPATIPGTASRSEAMAALAPAASARDRATPGVERFSSGRSRREADLTAPRTTVLDSLPTRGVAPPIESPARLAATPYQTRSGPAKARALEEHGGTPETEAAVARGLRYLARIQGRLGNWGPLDHHDAKYGEVCVGKTALVTLAFLAAGHTHVSASEHSAVVQRALAFLLATQERASGHLGDTSAYSHGIATFALAEALAITRDAALRESVERAVGHILERQSDDTDPQKRGGWSYYYVDPNREFDPWPRTSITAWQVMALESARLSGVSVPNAAFDEAARFLESAREPRADWYRYSHDPERLRSGYPTLPASTPAALFALSCIGRDIRGAEHAAAREYVLERAPRGFRFTNERDFVERAQGNPYFWYQATLAMFRVGGNVWRRWNAALQETLLPAQDDDGSWRPIDVYARYARDDESDRAYTTALCVLCLEVYYRYDLPLLSAGRPAAEPR